MSTCYSYLCACCAPYCRRCHHHLTDPSWPCYCDCCGPRAWWWRCCYGDDTYNAKTPRHVPNSIYTPTTVKEGEGANDGYRLIDTSVTDADDVTIFTRANGEQQGGSYGTTRSKSESQNPAGQNKGQVSAIGGKYNTEVPPVRYDHVVLRQPLLEDDVTFNVT